MHGAQGRDVDSCAGPRASDLVRANCTPLRAQSIKQPLIDVAKVQKRVKQLRKHAGQAPDSDNIGDEIGANGAGFVRDIEEITDSAAKGEISAHLVEQSFTVLDRISSIVPSEQNKLTELEIASNVGGDRTSVVISIDEGEKILRAMKLAEHQDVTDQGVVIQVNGKRNSMIIQSVRGKEVTCHLSEEIFKTLRAEGHLDIGARVRVTGSFGVWTKWNQQVRALGPGVGAATAPANSRQIRTRPSASISIRSRDSRPNRATARAVQRDSSIDVGPPLGRRRVGARGQGERREVPVGPLPDDPGPAEAGQARRVAGIEDHPLAVPQDAVDRVGGPEVDQRRRRLDFQLKLDAHSGDDPERVLEPPSRLDPALGAGESQVGRRRRRPRARQVDVPLEVEGSGERPLARRRGGRGPALRVAPPGTGAPTARRVVPVPDGEPARAGHDV
jgi:hypothetical protein